MTHTRHHRESGATVIEFAMIALLVFSLVFGIFEFGMAFRSRTTTKDAASDGARVGAIQGPSLTTAGQTADYSIIKAIREDTSAIDPEDILRIVIFKGSTSGSGSAASQVPSACKAGIPVTDAPGVRGCNVYDASTAFERVQDPTPAGAAYFNCALTPTSPACSWNPTSRRNGPRSSDIDYLGVWIRTKHGFVTGLFGPDLTIESASVLRLEPGVLE